MDALIPSLSRERAAERPLRFCTVDELMDRPPRRWLVANVLPADASAVMFGQPGHGKTFVAVDVALAVATGRRWHGHEVSPGKVLYIAAEAGAAIGPRAKAWLKRHGAAAAENLLILVDDVQLHDPVAVSRLLRALAERGFTPSLIVIDTLARCFVGAEENSNTDMGRLVKGVDSLVAGTGATVLLIHHSPKNGTATPRGGSALLAGVDTAISVSKNGRSINISCGKQKEQENFDDFTLNIETVEVERWGQVELVGVIGDAISRSPEQGRQVYGRDALALRLLQDAPDAPLTSSQWRDLISQATGQELSKDTFPKIARRLREAGLVEQPTKGLYLAVPADRHLPADTASTPASQCQHPVGVALAMGEGTRSMRRLAVPKGLTSKFLAREPDTVQ